MTSNDCRICQTPMLGSHYHESECRECGVEFFDCALLGVDESGVPYCVNCGADPREGIAWSTSRGPVVVIPDPDVLVAEIREAEAERGDD